MYKAFSEFRQTQVIIWTYQNLIHEAQQDIKEACNNNSPSNFEKWLSSKSRDPFIHEEEGELEDQTQILMKLKESFPDVIK